MILVYINNVSIDLVIKELKDRNFSCNIIPPQYNECGCIVKIDI